MLSSAGQFILVVYGDLIITTPSWNLRQSCIIITTPLWNLKRSFSRTHIGLKFCHFLQSVVSITEGPKNKIMRKSGIHSSAPCRESTLRADSRDSRPLTGINDRFPSRVGNRALVPSMVGIKKAFDSRLGSGIGPWFPSRVGNRAFASRERFDSRQGSGIVHWFPSRVGNRAFDSRQGSGIVHLFPSRDGNRHSHQSRELVTYSRVECDFRCFPLKARILSVFPWGTGIMSPFPSIKEPFLIFWFAYANFNFLGCL